MCFPPSLLTHTPGLPIALLSLTYKTLHDAALTVTHSCCVPATSDFSISRTFHFSPLHRTDKESDGDSNRGLAPAPEGPHEPAEETHQAPEAAPWDGVTVSSGPGATDVFQTLQHALSSLEAAAAAWRCQTLSCPGPIEAEGRTEGGPRPCLEHEGAGGCQREVACLAEKNAWLRLALGNREDELVNMQASLEAIQTEKEMLQREVSGAALPPRAPCLRKEAAWHK